ncbi:MAG TPA: GNAT family N-acetyltransferase [Candidatus Babeliales bacterium]|nr:GNAT family N-acetyltransferase [Candidatus Babeliales bacterium]
MKKFLLTITLLTITNIIPCENPNPYSIKVLTQDELKTLLPFVAQLRVNIFRNYPYLYDGNIAEEMDNLEKYAQHNNSALAIAYYNENPVGFLCGSDLIHYSVHFENSVADLFKGVDLNIENYYYCADIIILPEHRGKYLAPQLFDAIENYAQQKGYTACCFITEHHENHPLKPRDHKSLVPLWNSLNYKKSALITYASWQTHQVDGTIKLEQHPLIFWLKNLK